MPHSSPRGKAEIQRLVGLVPHSRMLDIGCGSGTYAKLFPDAIWTGVEAWAPYVEEYGLKDLYQRLVIDDVRTVEFRKQQHDVAICGDVLEHMTPQEAHDLIAKLCKKVAVVIASIPIGHWPQGEVNGNPFEEHVKDDWSHADVCALIGEPTYSYQDGEIGIYVWSDSYGRDTFAPKRLKIAVYTIALNEAQFVQRWADSARDADLLLIADTGSTDDTIELAKAAGVEVHGIEVKPWRFDVARNEALALLPEEYGVVVSLDMDEIMMPGWREEIERAWVLGTTRLRYFFDWGSDILFRYEKIHARNGYYWKHAVHETPMPLEPEKEVWAQTDKLLVKHLADASKSRSSYLPLLELSVAEDPEDPHHSFYLCREYQFHQQWQKAIDEGARYLKLPSATWVNERCYAYRVMGKAYAELGNIWAAETHYLMACAEAMGTREPFYELALLYYQNRRWLDCYTAALRCLAIERRDWVYTCNPEVWTGAPADLAAIAAWNLDWKAEAVKYGTLALEKSPADARIAANLDWYAGRKSEAA